LKPGEFADISISKILHTVFKVWSCWILKQRVAQKIGNYWGEKVAVVPTLMYYILQWYCGIIF